MEGTLTERISNRDWQNCYTALNLDGWSVLRNLIDEQECDRVAGLYGTSALFRSHVVMSRHGFGRGEYRYFAYPLPSLVRQLRASLDPHLAPLANEWHCRMGMRGEFAEEHGAYLEECHKAGQQRATPLLLRYGEGDYNCLHQDLYGEEVFPLQVAILLSDPHKDFEGGEFVVTEQRPRMQSRVSVVP
ncbi:MAG TPA: 2OG-Fe(II) oxygenase, partial [Sphingomicrobium sp.]|nr:2OG-Fe(II) oxygenase [Sphingomicrobium sp.]